jgi:hypothetical protein
MSIKKERTRKIRGVLLLVQEAKKGGNSRPMYTGNP